MKKFNAEIELTNQEVELLKKVDGLINNQKNLMEQRLRLIHFVIKVWLNM